MQLTASIVIYNNDLRTLERAMASFRGSPLAGKLFIIDNANQIEAIELSHKYDATYIRTGSNLGFGKAHNIALKSVMNGSGYHLVLNPDVEFDPAILSQLVAFMDGHLHAGLVMPRVLYPDGRIQPLCKLLPSPLDLLFRRFSPFPALTRRRNERYEMHFTGYNQIAEVPFLSGCFMFIRNSVLREVGLFDERFFLYAEDVDLSRRIHKVSKTYFYPFVSIYHEHTRGSHRDLRLMLYFIRSVVQYFNKWGWWLDTERTRINAAAGQVTFSHPSKVHQDPVTVQARL
ncbi:MAG: glycosyltransferase family 2 protein [Cyclobacteriaceae bacterium]|nr:glycosyltransferase family 2 protein [Cyclobacteriaceae bacterium]